MASQGRTAQRLPGPPPTSPLGKVTAGRARAGLPSLFLPKRPTSASPHPGHAGDGWHSRQRHRDCSSHPLNLKPGHRPYYPALRPHPEACPVTPRPSPRTCWPGVRPALRECPLAGRAPARTAARATAGVSVRGGRRGTRQAGWGSPEGPRSALGTMRSQRWPSLSQPPSHSQVPAHAYASGRLHEDSSRQKAWDGSAVARGG